jgi:GTP cyclohydrolase I
MDKEKIKKGVRLILEGIGEDLNKPGLKETPERIARMCEEIYCGINKDPSAHLQALEGETHDEMVIIKDIPFYSMCEHHLLPFAGKANIAYIPEGGRIVGISKLARALQALSKRPQLQERITTQLANAIVKAIKPQGVMVVIKAEHMCMSMRGIRKPNSIVVTSAIRGIFRRNEASRSEALELFK